MENPSSSDISEISSVVHPNDGVQRQDHAVLPEVLEHPYVCFLPYSLLDIFDGYNTTREFMAELANVCVKKHNETKGTTLELVNVARVTERGAATWRLYITFMAREFPDGPLVEYQAKVIVFLGDEERPFPVLCRASPKPGI